MDLHGILLGKGFGGAEGWEMGGEGSSSDGAFAEVMFKMGGKGESTFKGSAVGTGAKDGGGGWEMVTSA